MKKLLTSSALAFALATASFMPQVSAQENADTPSAAESPATAEGDAPAEAVEAKYPSAEPVKDATPKVRPLSVTVDLLSSTEIVGTLTDITSLDMQTSFGTANIPLSEVAGIRFASADDASTTVVMLNGDSITGATDVKLVTVETEWGTAAINGQSVQSILFVPNVVWNPNTGLNGKRWTLVSDKQPAPPAASTAPATPSNVPSQPVRNPDGSITYPNATFQQRPGFNSGR